MEIEVRDEGGIPVAVVSGEIDSKTAPQAQDALLGAITDGGKLLIEMSKDTFLSSAGLRMLLLVYRQAVAQSGKVALVGVSEEVKDTMSMTGFLKFFHVTDSLKQAYVHGWQNNINDTNRTRWVSIDEAARAAKFPNRYGR